MTRIAVCSVALAIALGGAAPARAQEAGITMLYVGLPIMDSVIFVGGVTAGLAGSVALVDGRPSPGWKSANFAFGALNCVSVLGYGITMGVIPDIWPFLLWPLIAHAGLAIGNFIIGNKLTNLSPRTARLALVPMVGVDRGATFGGLALRVVR